MEEERLKPEVEEEAAAPEAEPVKTPFQLQKESWYDKVPLNFKQLDLIVKLCWLAIFILIAVIALDAMDIFNPFGY